MSVSDFEEMDTDEFSAMLDVWNEHEDGTRRESWERARIVGALAVSPWVKGRTRPERILPLPWDKANAQSFKRSPQSAKPLSREEDMKRLKALMGK